MYSAMRIGVGQLTSTSNPLLNGLKVSRLIQKAHSAGCKVLFLPEASDYIAGSPAETVSLAQPIVESEFFNEIRNALTKWPLYVSVGVHEPGNISPSRVRNTLLWVSPQGKILNRYQKMHLFDADVPNGPILRESKSVEPGKVFPELIEVPDTPFTIGPQICYDIRFPETAKELSARGASIIVFPSAFTVKTGQVHWTTLNKARAIDNQCFVISAGQVGQHDEAGKRVSYGHSIVVDPWGEVLVEDVSDNDESLSVVDIDFGKVNEVRGNMPLNEQRKGVPTE